MNAQELEADLKLSYNSGLTSVNDRVADITHHMSKELDIKVNKLSHSDIQTLSTTILNIETISLHDEIESLLIEKEKIEKKIEKRAQDLQEVKYSVFNALELQLNSDDTGVLTQLHQIKLQEIDLYDLLGEIVESAIITALEKDTEINESIIEVINNITFEAIKEGSLNTIRIRKILSTILQAAIEIADASPAKVREVLEPTLKGMRAGLIHAISRFKQRLSFIPVEAKHILIEDYDTIIEDLNQTDALFAQVIQTQADSSSAVVAKNLEVLSKEMRYDLDELLRVSKETADVMKEKFASLASRTMKKADKALNVDVAKRIGKQAIGVAKSTIDSALKSAKNVIDKK